MTTSRLPTDASDKMLVSLVKGSEKYVFIFSLDRRSAFFHTLGRFAANPELSFTWYDAAVLSKRTRELLDVAEEKR